MSIPMVRDMVCATRGSGSLLNAFSRTGSSSAVPPVTIEVVKKFRREKVE
jgi:hypothetical protein